ncbi:MAG: hypothetical protein IPI55_02195 [Flavobacteriales bacterium]|nr:hypothetical protein [Flavobacteriales bacterium]
MKVPGQMKDRSIAQVVDGDLVIVMLPALVATEQGGAPFVMLEPDALSGGSDARFKLRPFLR